LFLWGFSTCMSSNGISSRMTWDATMTLCSISATTTYVVWREEHICKVNAGYCKVYTFPVMLHFRPVLRTFGTSPVNCVQSNYLHVLVCSEPMTSFI
jgi:hypothetical protein